MPRRLFFLLLFLALVLAACKSTSQTGTVTAEASDTPKATNTTASPTTAPKQADTFNLPEQPSVPGCTVVSFMPTPDPTSLFPAITENDYYRGPLTATVKIIEYSDFQ
jgi:hypothetical protein